MTQPVTQPWQPAADALPDQIAIFPLAGALLLPRGRLPLNIFERRYLAMVEDSLGAGRMLGMIQPERAAASGPAGSSLYRIGCLGRIASFSETEDGRLLITLHGVIRFAVAEELELRRGYRRIRADYTGFLGDLGPPSYSPPLDRTELLDHLRGYFTRTGFEANWDAIRKMSDDTLVVTLCMVCPFSAAEKQALLEAPTDTDRTTALVALLQMGGLDRDSDTPGRAAS